MHVSLTPELETRVKAKIESGLYNNASEVIREALRFMEMHEDWIREVKLAQLREQLQTAAHQIDQGHGIKITPRPTSTIYLRIFSNSHSNEIHSIGFIAKGKRRPKRNLSSWDRNVRVDSIHEVLVADKKSGFELNRIPADRNRSRNAYERRPQYLCRKSHYFLSASK